MVRKNITQQRFSKRICLANIYFYAPMKIRVIVFFLFFFFGVCVFLVFDLVFFGGGGISASLFLSRSLWSYLQRGALYCRDGRESEVNILFPGELLTVFFLIFAKKWSQQAEMFLSVLSFLRWKQRDKLFLALHQRFFSHGCLSRVVLQAGLSSLCQSL